MSFLDQLKAKKKCLKSTVTNITHADGSQEQILFTNTGNDMLETSRVKLESKNFGFIVDTKPDIVPACILNDFLYFGSQDAVTQENIQKYKLTDILSIGIETPASDIHSNVIRTHFVACLDLPETCLEPIVRQSNQIINSVLERMGRILIHCNAGVSRSSTICIAYLILVNKMNFDAAFELVKSKRECIRPNDGFLKQLKRMDQNNDA